MKKNEESEERREGASVNDHSGRNDSPYRLDILNRAKKIVMDRFHLSESDAHRYIQKRAMDSGTGLVEMSEMVIMLYGQMITTNVANEKSSRTMELLVTSVVFFFAPKSVLLTKHNLRENGIVLI